MYAEGAEDGSPTSSVEPATGVSGLTTNRQQANSSRCVAGTLSTSSTLSYRVWERGLLNHPDRTYVQEILHDIFYDVNIGYHGPQNYNKTCKIKLSRNWPSVNRFLPDIIKAINEDVNKGRVIGPAHTPMFHNFVTNSRNLASFVLSQTYHGRR